MKTYLFNWTAKENVWYSLADYEPPVWTPDVFDIWEEVLVCSIDDPDEGVHIIQTPVSRSDLVFTSSHYEEEFIKATHFMLISAP